MIAFLLTQPNTKPLIASRSFLDDEKILVAGLRASDFSSFSRLYKMYAANLMGVIMKIVKQQETAEDLLQEVFLKIEKAIFTYDETKSRLFTWMFSIARNTALDHLRKKSSKQEKTNMLLEDAVQEMKNHTYSFNPDTIGVRKLLDKLSQKQKLVLDLAYFQGYTHQEIAQQIDMPVGSVKTCLRSAILKLRTIFGKS